MKCFANICKYLLLQLFTTAFSKMTENNSFLIPGGGFHAFWFGYGCGKELSTKYERTKFYGYSAGAMAAVLAAMDTPEDDVVRVASSLVESCRIGALDNVIKLMMTDLLPNDAHIKLKGVVNIIICSCGDWFMGKVVNEWSSLDELINCVIASCFIPGVVSLSFKDPAYGAIDGTFCRNLTSICEGLQEISGPTPGFCERFHVISEDEALDLFKSGRESAANW